MNDNSMHLDSSDIAWMRRELEYIEKTQYEEIFEGLKARDIIPPQDGVPDWANAYVSQMWSKVGKAEVIGGQAHDLPRVDVTRSEATQVIKDIGISYGYTFKEIKRAIATGVHLDVIRAAAAREAIERETDEILSLGLTVNGLVGALKTAATVTVAITKTGGGTNWTAAAKPDEIAGDVFKLIGDIRSRLKTGGGTVFEKFRVAMPDENYTHIAQRRMGDGTDTKILDFVKSSTFVESVVNWARCSAAAANNVDDRMMAFPPNKMVLGAIVPMEFTQVNPEQRGIEWIVPCLGAVGGVFVRYLMAMGYMDTIDVA